MEKEKSKYYAEILLNAYKNKILEIVWSTKGFSIAIDSEKKEVLPEIKEQDFLEYVFSVIKVVMDMVEDRDVSDITQDKLDIAKVIFEQEEDLRDHLYVKKHSKIESFRILDYEIIAHRDEKNPKVILANSAILKVMVEKGEDEKSYTFETSRRDLEKMIEQLVELKEKIDNIEEV